LLSQYQLTNRLSQCILNNFLRW